MSAERKGGRPPRPRAEWSRPPFEPGNQLGTTHGAFSAARVDPVASDLIDAAIEAVPYLGEGAFRPALEAWARAEARARLLASWLDEHGLLDAKGRPRHAAQFAVTVERQAAEARARLGLDPASRAKLERDVSAARFDISREMAALDEEDA